MSARANTSANAPLSGAREARPSASRRLLARAAARDLTAFVVPGPDVARARGIDLEAAGLRVADTPRHASVLVIIGDLPVRLKKVSAVAYAQMPRPRAILAVDAGSIAPLPAPDVSVAKASLGGGVEELRRRFAGGAFAGEAPDFDVDEVQTRTEYACPMHPDITSDEPGSCPRCGMDLVPREAAGDAHDHEGHDYSRHGDTEHEEESSEPGYGDHNGSGEHEHAEHGQHEGHGGMDHGDMGFMSMVAMTEGTPRSSDGLQMEWAVAPFGPLSPGLPGGLTLKFTLDGDTVAEAKATGVGERNPEARDDASAWDLPGRLTRINPLSPVAYRVLALRSIEAAAGVGADESVLLQRIGALERERAAGHLGWLAGFGHLLGHPWLRERAGRLQISLLRARDAAEVAHLTPEVGRLLRRVPRTPLLPHRLKGIGLLPGPANASGPVARAGGSGRDARSEDAAYRSLGFEPVVREGDDAFARLGVRLAEIEQSLELVRRAGSVSAPEATPVEGVSGSGGATVETPRGAARLRIALENGTVTTFEIDAPSTGHAGLVGAVAEGRELADALVGVASLDLSPWEVAG